MKPPRPFMMAPAEPTFEAVACLPPDEITLTWQLDRLATELCAGLAPETIAALVSLGSIVIGDRDGYVIDYVPSRSIGVARHRRGLYLQGTRRTVYGCAGLWGRERLRDVLRSRGATDLPALAEALRDELSAADLPLPRQWCGPGDLAAAALRRYKFVPLADPDPLAGLPDMLLAYYGGRIEVTAHGDVPRDLWEYDLRSAYGWAIGELPSPVGQWRDGEGWWGVCLIRWRRNRALARNAGPAMLGPFPSRSASGSLSYPLAGMGLYWQPEIEAARRAGYDVEVLRAWHWMPDDPEARPWRAMVAELHTARVPAPSSKPLLPAMYGKLIQRIGNTRWRSLTYASLVTAMVRAAVLDAASQSPSDIVMISTDSIVSLRPLGLFLGERPGEWRMTEHRGGLHIVAPGLYWSLRGDDRVRTRGFPRDALLSRRRDMMALWRDWSPEQQPPGLAIPMRLLLTIPLAAALDLPPGGEREIDMPVRYSWPGRRSKLAQIDGLWRSLPRRLGGANHPYDMPARRDPLSLLETEL